MSSPKPVSQHLPGSIYMDEWTSADLDDALQSCEPLQATLVLPLGSVEPHGPHLPLNTDHLLAVENAERAVQLGLELHVVVYEGKAKSVVDGRPEQEVSVVPVGHSLVDAVVRADQVVLCGCSQLWLHWIVMATVRSPLKKLRVLLPHSRSSIRIRMGS